MRPTFSADRFLELPEVWGRDRAGLQYSHRMRRGIASGSSFPTARGLVCPVLGSGADGSKLSGVAPAVPAHQEVDPDQSPLGPSGVDQLLAGYEARNFFTARHETMALYLWFPGIRAGDCGPDAEGLLG